MAQALRSMAGDGPAIVMERKGLRRRRVEKYPEPDWGPPVEIDQIIDEALVFSRERTACVIVADDFAAAVLRAVAADRIPLDDVLPQLETVRLYVEAFLLARITWPGLCPPAPEIVADDPPGRSEDYAIACGLTIIPPPRNRARTAPTLPGCQWPNTNGEPCRELRCFGAKYCRGHERLVREAMRSRQE